MDHFEDGVIPHASFSVVWQDGIWKFNCEVSGIGKTVRDEGGYPTIEECLKEIGESVKSNFQPLLKKIEIEKKKKNA